MSTKTLGCPPDPVVEASEATPYQEGGKAAVARRRACIGDMLARGMTPKDMIEPVCRQFGEISLGTLYNDVKWLRANKTANPARSWTDEMDRRCLAMKAAGDSLAKIAEALGVSRSAVSGRLYRLERAAAKAAGKPVQRRATKSPAVKPDAKALQTASRRPSQRLHRLAEPETPPVPYVPVTDTADNRPTGAPAAVMALTARSCRWPIGDPCDADFRFCGATALDGSSWCAEHAAIAWPAGGAS